MSVLPYWLNKKAALFRGSPSKDNIDWNDYIPDGEAGSLGSPALRTGIPTSK